MSIVDFQQYRIVSTNSLPRNSYFEKRILHIPVLTSRYEYHKNMFKKYKKICKSSFYDDAGKN